MIDSDLYPLGASNRTGAAWYAAYTHLKCEARAAAAISALGHTVFLPLERRWVRHARYKTQSDRPLFARYLFVCFDLARDAWEAIAHADGVDRILGNEGPVRMPSAEIAAIVGAQAVGAFDETKAISRAEIGELVQIVAGPLAGFIGELQSADTAQERADILVAMLGRKTKVRFDFSDLRLVGGKSYATA